VKSAPPENAEATQKLCHPRATFVSWNLQQLGQFRDVSNFNVGLFAQQAGLSLGCATLQDAFEFQGAAPFGVWFIKGCGFRVNFLGSADESEKETQAGQPALHRMPVNPLMTSNCFRTALPAI
jgi:hypothetical protein